MEHRLGADVRHLFSANPVTGRVYNLEQEPPQVGALLHCTLIPWDSP